MLCQVYLPIYRSKRRLSSMELILPLPPRLNKASTKIRQTSGKENKAYKSDSIGRQKVAHQRALFKMADPSTSATPSPTTTAAFVTQTVSAQLLVGIRSQTRPRNAIGYTARHLNASLLEAQILRGPEERSFNCLVNRIHVLNSHNN